MPKRSTVDNVRQWATLILCIGNLVLMVGYVSWWGRGMEARDEAIETKIAHHDEATTHMSLQSKIDLFVLRGEFEKASGIRDGQLISLRRELTEKIADLDKKVERVLDALDG